MRESESLKAILEGIGGEAMADLPDNSATAYYEGIIKHLGGSVDDLPDRLDSTYLKRIGELISGGAGGSGGGSPCAFIYGVVPYHPPIVTTDTGYTIELPLMGTFEGQDHSSDVGVFITDINKEFTIEGDSLLITTSGVNSPENATVELLEESPLASGFYARKYKVKLTGSPAKVYIECFD